MKVKLDRNIILKAFNIADAIIPSRQLNDIFSNALLKVESGKLFIYATDLEVFIKVFVSSVDLKDTGITLPSKKVISVLREFDSDDVEIEWDDSFRANINSAGNDDITKKFVVSGTNPEEFPVIDLPSDIDWIKVDAEVLRDMIKKTYFASSQGKETYKYIFNGVYFDAKNKDLNLVATDGKRLSYVQRRLNTNKKLNINAVVPGKAILELEKVLDGEKECEFAFDNRNAYFKIDDIIITSRLIEGQFPDYESVIPKELNSSITLNREKVLSALRGASIFAKEDQFEKTNFVFEKGKLNISSESSSGTADVSISIEYADEPISIVFNNSFVVDVLKSVEFETFILGLNTNSDPALFLFNDDKDYKYVLMPVRT